MKSERECGRATRCSVSLSLALLLMSLWTSAAIAASSYLNTFGSTYPGSATSNGGCQVCHASSTQNVNPYGTSFCNQGGNTASRMASIENVNSDNDSTGSNNITEINAGTQPGWTTGNNPIASRGSCSNNGSETEPFGGSLALDPTVGVPDEVCDNGADDDNDGLTDCADPDCNGFVGAPTSCGTGACGAGGNLVCQGGAEVDTCTPGAPTAEGPFGDATCADGIDNNCDTLTDGNDPNCSEPAEICDNGIDDNLDGNTDCADAQCEGFVFGETTCGVGACGATGQDACVGGVRTDTCAPGAPGSEGPAGDATCTDGIDNNCNELVDAADPACAAADPEICDNGIDDNGDGNTDCADPQCEGFVLGECSTGRPGICAAGTNVCSSGAEVCVQDQAEQVEGPNGSASCSDGLDNDCDAQVDVDDADCAFVAEICDNGVDDDGNGLTDCEDSACDGFVGGACNTGMSGVCAEGTSVCRSGSQFCDQTTAAGTEGPVGDASCSDTLDNDCDGATDASDPGCQEATGADAYLTSMRRVEDYRGEVGHTEKKTIRVNGGSTIEQDATVVLSAETSANLRVDIRPDSRTREVEEGETERFYFSAYITCTGSGTGEVNWMATIDAAANDDPGNDTQTGSTRVFCSGGDEDDDDDDRHHRRRHHD